MSSPLKRLRVYATYPHSCSYLAGRQATALFVDPRARIDRQLYSQLSLLGFRRSGAHLYRPHCAGCSACVPARIVVDDFQPRRSQRRVWRNNRDLRVEAVDSIARPEYFRLYSKYIESRHPRGDMYPPLREQYETFLSDEWGVTRYHRIGLARRVLGVAVTDELADGLSAIYTFYDPEQRRRSLGSFAILWQIELARELGLAYLYLGHWIRDCRKMAYKTRFRPLELYRDGRWSPL